MHSNGLPDALAAHVCVQAVRGALAARVCVQSVNDTLAARVCVQLLFWPSIIEDLFDVPLRMCAFKSFLRWQLARLALAAHVCIEKRQKQISLLLDVSLRMCVFEMLPLKNVIVGCACDALAAHVCVQHNFWLLPNALAAHVCVQIVLWLFKSAQTY